MVQWSLVFAENFVNYLPIIRILLHSGNIRCHGRNVNIWNNCPQIYMTSQIEPLINNSIFTKYRMNQERAKMSKSIFVNTVIFVQKV